MLDGDGKIPFVHRPLVLRLFQKATRAGHDATISQKHLLEWSVLSALDHLVCHRRILMPLSFTRKRGTRTLVFEHPEAGYYHEVSDEEFKVIAGALHHELWWQVQCLAQGVYPNGEPIPNAVRKPVDPEKTTAIYTSTAKTEKDPNC